MEYTFRCLSMITDDIGIRYFQLVDSPHREHRASLSSFNMILRILRNRAIGPLKWNQPIESARDTNCLNCHNRARKKPPRDRRSPMQCAMTSSCRIYKTSVTITYLLLFMRDKSDRTPDIIGTCVGVAPSASLMVILCNVPFPFLLTIRSNI